MSAGGCHLNLVRPALKMSGMGDDASEWLPPGFRAAAGKRAPRRAPAPESMEFVPDPARPPTADPGIAAVRRPPRPQRPPAAATPPPRPRPIGSRRTVRAGTRGTGELDLNAASFEEVRALGLTIGEAARFISQRDRRRGLRFIEEIETFYGIPAEVKRKLTARGRV